MNCYSNHEAVNVQMTHIGFTVLMIGIVLIFVIISSLIFAYSKKQDRKTISKSQKLAGSLTLSLGLIMMFFWSYFVMTGWSSMMMKIDKLLPHVILQLVTAMSLFLAGIGTLRGWSRGPALLVTSAGILIFTMILSFINYGTMGHPMTMNAVATVVTLIFLIMIGLVYNWEHFVFKLDENKSSK